MSNDPLTTPHALGWTRRWLGYDCKVVPLGNGEIGYCMTPNQTFDCLRPAIATVLQIPLEQLPDARIDKRLDTGDPPEVIVRESWARLVRWLHGRGVQLVVHETVPVRKHRWIGVCKSPNSSFLDELLKDTPDSGAAFSDHSVVMCHDRVVFDPAISLRAPPGMRLYRYELADVRYGISFDRREQGNGSH